MALKEIFQDEKGGLSFMRAASFIALLQGMAQAWYGWIVGKSAVEIVTVITIWVVAAFVPKAIQKFAEVKTPVTPEEGK